MLPHILLAQQTVSISGRALDAPFGLAISCKLHTWTTQSCEALVVGGSMALPLLALSALGHSARQWLMGSCVLLQPLLLPSLLCFSSEYLHSCIKSTFLSSCPLFALSYSAMHFLSTSLLDLLFVTSLYFPYCFPGPTSMLQSVCPLQQLSVFSTGANSSKWTISAAQHPEGWQSINYALSHFVFSILRHLG